MTGRAAALRTLVGLRKESALEIIRKSPALFLAYAALRRSLRSQHGFMQGAPATIIVVMGGSAATDSHRKAAEMLAAGTLDVRSRLRRFERKALVHILDTTDKKKSKDDNSLMEEFGKRDVIVILARSRSEITSDLALVADATVDLAPPTVEHVHAVRRMLRRVPVSENTARAIINLDFQLLVPVACKHSISEIDVRNLLSASAQGSVGAGPRLEELPGYTSAKIWAQRFISDIRHFQTGGIDWSTIPRGVLLYGPPGTGKTLFAQAFARSASLPLISASVSRWQSAGHLGDLLKAMRETFERARAQQPSIIFLDELDSIGDREKFTGEHVGYSRQVVNFLLELIDGAEGRDRIFVIGATNFREAIDPALLRSGRIERHIKIDLPDSRERADILRFHLGLADAEAELSDIAAELGGWTGADLEMLSREAKARSRARGQALAIADLIDSLPPVREMSSAYARRVAFHEAGHAVVATALNPTCRVKVRIRRRVRDISRRDMPPGLAEYDYPGDEDPPSTPADFRDLICRALAGGAAEEFRLGSRSNGFAVSVGSDLEFATVVASRMVASYGMGKRLQFLMESRHVDAKRLSRLPVEFMEEINEILQEQYARAYAILVEHSAFLDELADELLEKEQLGEDDVAKIAARTTGATKDSKLSAFNSSAR
ncbi:hypothetical protein ACO34A_07260 [Rhizobium sp. ACO-34A]|nr:AAA family ATPase [Rhizobium sp. ACO-34A]ATN33603.1 hypothetical protein ACO34A_07260 [Rhizobium sp. ACO-34A]